MIFLASKVQFSFAFIRLRPPFGETWSDSSENPMLGGQVQSGSVVEDFKV